jgi:AraC-like DNA-binding protein
MNLLEHTSPQSILYFILYGGAATLCVVLCLYLLLSRVNVISPGTMPPVRLRRWAAAFYAAGALGHAWWILLYLYFRDNQLVYGTDYSPSHVMGEVLDCVSLLITLAGTLLAMLQDRRRPVWPVAVASIPIAVLGVLQMAFPTRQFLVPALVYSLVAYVAFTVYMVFAVRQYGRWLLDNYADLEHKEVWLSHTLLLLLLLLVVVYGFAADDPSFFLIRIADFVLFGLLLWRVETLPQLEEQENQPQPQPLPVGMSVVSPSAEELERKTTTDETEIIGEKSIAPAPSQGGSGGESPVSIDLDQIEQLLKKHCADTQLYLQPDLTLPQLASAIGTNRSYLSQYFSRQSITYNTYINNLRINHFITRYRKATAARQPIIAQQLASDSGYRSYSTFGRAFIQRMGQSVTAWMRQSAK